jgi:putative Ca2+/H+ antiporter (TMEM165/GDT1 family)
MAGILIATVVNHALAASVGAWLAAALPRRAMGILLGVGFIAFGLWTLIPDRADGERPPSRWGPLLTTSVVFFLAEMGDKTQLATVALGARFDSTVAVTAGTTLGMLAADGLAIFAGHRLTAIVPMRVVRWIAAALFFAFGGAAIAATVRAGEAPLDLRALAVGGADHRLDAAAHVEVPHHLDPAWCRRRHEIVEDAVGHVLVEGADVPVRPGVELDRPELDEPLVGHVADAEGREVGLAGHRAEAGELRDLERDLIVAVGVRVRHRLELSRRPARHGQTLPRPRRAGQGAGAPG